MDPKSISTRELYMRLMSENAPDVIDVSIDDDYNDDPHLIPGARRVRHTDLSKQSWCKDSVVFVCQKGKKLSVGAAALLHRQKPNVRFLEGGNYAWRDAGFPRVIGDQKYADHSIFIAPTQVRCETLMSAWLISRFQSKGIGFMWVPYDMTSDVAEKFEIPLMPATNEVLSSLTQAEPIEDFLTTLGGTSMFATLLKGLRLRHRLFEDVVQDSAALFDTAWAGFCAPEGTI